MKPYKFSKIWLLAINKYNNKLESRVVKWSAIISAPGIPLYFLVSKDFVWLVIFPFGIPGILSVFVKTVIIWIEDRRIERYCKKNKMTIDQFNAEYGNK